MKCDKVYNIINGFTNTFDLFSASFQNNNNNNNKNIFLNIVPKYCNSSFEYVLLQYTSFFCKFQNEYP